MLTQAAPTEIIHQQRRFFQQGTTKNVEFRLKQLHQLKALIQKNQDAIAQALKDDLKKPAFEAIGSEILFSIGNIDHTIQHLRNWAKPQKVSVPLTQLPASAQIISEPLGVVLIIGPWNYPFQLLILPLVGAIAAGNCAILKPSELVPHTSKLVADLIAKNFDPGFLSVVEGGKEIAQDLLKEKFDHIFFTGGTQVGKIIMQAAAEHLTPVTLELGGKSPCIIEPDADIATTARRITWSKFINSGQSCIAPDYLLVHQQIKAPLLAELKISIQEFYGENPEKSPDYARIISENHFQRLCQLLNPDKIVFGGKTNADERYIAPTIMDGVSWEDKVMEDEIFGPILPLLTYSDLGGAIAQINTRPKPLALYLFTDNKSTQQRVLKETSSGSVCINDAMVQCVCEELPFGGVGNSGIGAYHGKFSFDTFSHRKSVLNRWSWPDFKLRYPPYQGKGEMLKRLIK
ncbi:aldehyde dehydrogenase [Lusitaniella coriacea]|uniref:aldehyde dehydrogenase n=1 Tax=Lusitaniella coriacea TaxID=1983105 RepID=UPI003CF4217E